MAGLAVHGRLEAIQRTGLSGGEGVCSDFESGGLLSPTGEVALRGFIEGQFLGQKGHLLEVVFIALPLGDAGAQRCLALESLFHDLLDR